MVFSFAVTKARVMSELSNKQLMVSNKARQVERQPKGSGLAWKKKVAEPSEFEMENQTLGETLR